jgi:pimeloyl-ACP methyl ester carboxylesterase
MRSRALAITALTLALGLSGCVQVRVPEGAFFYPNTRLEAEGIELPPGPPMPGGTEALALPYDGGAVALSRVRGNASGPIILFCGGNMFRRAAAGADRAAALAPFGDVVMFDYPGYGETPGEATLDNFRLAGRAVADYVARTAAAEGRQVVAWGHSLGGPVCTEATRMIEVDTLVIEASTPTARAAVNHSLGLLRPFVRVNIDPGLDSFNIVQSLSGYRGRVLVLEAGRDETLPPRLSRDMARDLTAAGVSVERLVFPEADHNNIRAQPDFAARIAAALAP